MPKTPPRLSVSRLSAIEGFGVSLEDAAHPVGVVGELGERFDGEGEVGTVFVADAVPAEHDCFEQGQIALLAELAELLTAQALEGDVECAGIERAAVSGFFDGYRPLEGFDLLANERHKLFG